jgi:hypothetical protein
MKKCTIVVLLLALSIVASAQNWTQLGFSAEPGVSFGTPAMGNLATRFWYGGFGIGASAMGFPSGLNLGIGGAGVEADLMYRYVDKRLRGVKPYAAVGYGSSNITFGSTTTTAFRVGSYVGVQVGAYYSSFFAQLGLGVAVDGNGFTVFNRRVGSVFPLFQIGYLYGS